MISGESAMGVRTAVSRHVVRADAAPRHAPIPSGSVRFGRICAVVFALLGLLLYFPLLLGRVPFPADIVLFFPPWSSIPPLSGAGATPHAELGDLVTAIYPWRAFAAQTLRHGMMPLWNPHILIGTPFTAEPQTGIFSPLMVLYLLLPTAIAWAWSFPIRLILAGILTAGFVRRIGGSVAGSLASGIVFALCGFVTAWQGWPLVESAVWLPAVFLAVHALNREATAATAGLAAIAFALPVLGGHPEVAFHVILAGGLFAGYRAIWPTQSPEHTESRIRYLLLFGVAAGVGAGLAAIQLLPTIEWLREISRTLDASWGHRAGHDVLAFVSRDHLRNPSVIGVMIPEGAAYAGMLTLIVAPLAVMYQRRDAIFFGVLACASVEIAYGWQPFYWLSQHTPVLKGLPNWRLLLIADFSLAVLAGLGVTALERREICRSPRAVLWIALPSVAALVAAAGVTYSQLQIATVARSVIWLMYDPWGSALLLVAGVIVVSARLAGTLRGPAFATIAVALVAVDMASYAAGHVPFVRTDRIFPDTPTFQFLRQQDASAFRVASVDVTYGSNFEMPYGLSSATGYDFMLRRTSAFLAGLTPTGGYHLQADKVLTASPTFLDLLNVKYLIATPYNGSVAKLDSQPDRFRPVFHDGPTTVYENVSALPRAFLVPVSGVEVIVAEDRQLARLRKGSFNPRTMVILSEAPALRSPGDSAGTVSTVRIVNQTSQGMRLHVEAAEPSVLVVSQTYYPGWRAAIDGAEAPVLRADYTLQGVAVGPGRHDIDLMFRPRSFRLGLTTSFVAFLLTAAMIVPRLRPRKNRPAVPEPSVT